MHNEIKLRLKAEHECYSAISHLLKKKILSNNTKENLYFTYLRPDVLYVCTWSTITRYENRLNIF